MPGRLPTLSSWFPLLAALLLARASLARADEPPTYESTIRPILARRCTACHNPKKLDDPDLSGGLALDSYEAVLKGTQQHHVIEPGHADRSELIKRVNETDEDRRMPLMDDPLSASERTLLGRWIDAGAPRGEPVAAAGTTPPAAKRPMFRPIRSVDVVVPLDVKAPKGVEGMGPGGAVELVLKVGPLPVVSALAFRGDGSALAVGTYGQVTLWDLEDGRPICVLRDLPGPVPALAFSRDGKRLAVGSGRPAESGSVRIYAVPDGTLEQELDGHGDVVYALAFRPDGAQLASAGFDQTVRIWNLLDGRNEVTFKGHSDFVYEVAYTPDGRNILSTSKDRSIKRFDARTGKGLRTYSDHDDDVLALAIKPDGSAFVSAGNEPQLRWWTIEGEKPTRKVGGHSGPVYQVAFSGNGKRLISAGGDKSVRLWDGTTGIFQRTLPGPTDWQYAAALSHDGRIAAAGGGDGLVRVWNADSGQLLATLIQPPSLSPATTDWLAVAPSGYLAAGEELLDLVRWRVGGSAVPPEPARQRFVQPEQVAHALRGEPVPNAFATAK